MTNEAVPKGFEVVKLGELLQLIRTGTSEKQVDYTTNYPVTRIETISTQEINFDKVGYLTQARTSFKLQQGDVLISNINSVAHIGKVAIFHNKKDLYHGMNLLIFRFNEKVDPQYAYYYLRLSKPWFERMCAQAVNQASINQSTIMMLPFLKPKDVKEQKKIAKILQTLDSAIEKTKNLICKNKKIKDGLMQDLLTGKKRVEVSLFKQNKLPLNKNETSTQRNSAMTNEAVPKGFEVVKLGELLQLIRTGTSEKQVDYTTNYPVTRIETISTQEINFDKVGYLTQARTSFKLQQGDVLISNINSVAHIGKVAIFHNKKDLYHGMNLLIFRFNEKVDPQYAYYYLRLSKPWFERMCAQAVNQASINQSTIMMLPFLKPKDVKEQKKIASYLAKSDDTINKYIAEVSKLLKIKKGLMQDLLTGKQRVKV